MEISFISNVHAITRPRGCVVNLKQVFLPAGPIGNGVELLRSYVATTFGFTILVRCKDEQLQSQHHSRMRRPSPAVQENNNER